MDILEEIVARKRIDLDHLKTVYTEHDIHREVEKLMDEGNPVASMRKALMQSKTGIIAEFKRRSPSKGWIKEDADASIIPLAYQQSGASALSPLHRRHHRLPRDRACSCLVFPGMGRCDLPRRRHRVFLEKISVLKRSRLLVGRRDLFAWRRMSSASDTPLK